MSGFCSAHKEFQKGCPACTSSVAADLRKEAIDKLNHMFGVPEGFSNNSIDRIVDCIIGSALLEMSLMVNETVRGMGEKQ